MDRQTSENRSERGELRNPFRSESDAFWLLGVVGAAAALVTLAAVAFGAVAALIVFLIVLAVGTRSFVGWIRASIEAPDEPVEPPEAEGEAHPTGEGQPQAAAGSD